jgi:hypothetical protein
VSWLAPPGPLPQRSESYGGDNNLMKTTALIITFIFLIAFYSNAQPIETYQQEERFSSEELIGYVLSLVSETDIRVYSFNENGIVLITSGMIGGGIAYPASKWQIDSKGRLMLGDPKSYRLWTKLSEKDDLIEIENSVGRTDSKPYQREYVIQQGADSVVDKDYLTDRFTTEELSGSSLVWDANLTWYNYNTHAFKSDGTGTFSITPQKMIPEGQRKYRWAVDKEGVLLLFVKDGRIESWRKISRKNDRIIAKITVSPSPPRRETYRKSKR